MICLWDAGDYITWIQGSLNRADISKKTDPLLTETIHSTLASGVLQVDMSSCESTSLRNQFGKAEEYMNYDWPIYLFS